jgi:Spx/MgsR family transcriptional regulator
MKAYGLKKCSTCQKTMDWFESRKINVALTDHSVTPPNSEQVARWSKALGGWEKLVNRAGYTWRGLPKNEIEGLTEAGAVKLAMKHPSLIRRPLIEHDDGSVTVGFSEKVKALF